MAARAMGRGKGGRAGDAESRVEEQGLGWAGFLKLDGAREAGLGDTRRSAILIKMGLGWAWGGPRVGLGKQKNVYRGTMFRFRKL